ncbi:MAG: segregation/condensation protein A, partial [bacterium]
MNELQNDNGDYRVNLEVFEGPLDLLFHLIKKNDLDIYDIPIAFVLEEYMRYIDTIRELDIDLAGDF